jgi:branched-chain amino acid transport system permease protein
MQGVVQELAFGLFAGSIYGIAAAGLALVFGVLRVLNVAHGELLLLGGYGSFWLFALLGIDPFVSLLLVVPGLFLLGVALDGLVFRRLASLEGEERVKSSLLVSFGLTLILQHAMQQLFTADERTVPLGYAGSVASAFGVALPATRSLSLLIALAAMLALHLFLRHTYAGKAIRAVAEDGEGASLVGIDRRRVHRLTLGLGAALAGVAGSLVVVSYGVDPGGGLTWTLKAVVVLTLAGSGSVLGAFPAGLLLGLVEAVSGMALGATWREVAGLVVFLLVLLLRPAGLFRRA